MHVFNNAIQQSIFKGPVRNSKPKRIFPKHRRQLILKKHRLWKKIHNQDSLAIHRAVSREAKSALRNLFLDKNKNYLNVIINLPSINTY